MFFRKFQEISRKNSRKFPYCSRPQGYLNIYPPPALLARHLGGTINSRRKKTWVREINHAGLGCTAPPLIFVISFVSLLFTYGNNILFSWKRPTKTHNLEENSVPWKIPLKFRDRFTDLKDLSSCCLSALSISCSASARRRIYLPIYLSSTSIC